MPNLIETADRTGLFRTLVNAVRTAGLVPILSVGGPFTLFAPTDEAFARLPPETMARLLRDREALVEMLACHMVAGRHTGAGFLARRSLKTLVGRRVRIDRRGGLRVNRARVIAPDVLTDNGIIHVVDRVFLPEELT